MKRAIAALLASLTLLFSVPVSAFAEESPPAHAHGEVEEVIYDDSAESPAQDKEETSSEEVPTEAVQEPEASSENTEGTQEEEESKAAYEELVAEMEEEESQRTEAAQLQEEILTQEIAPDGSEFDASAVTPDDYISLLAETGNDLPAGPETAPELLYRTESEVAVKAVSGQEYSIDNGRNWVRSGRFTNIEPDMEYLVVSRYERNGSTPASASSPALVVSTDIKQKPPARPRAISITRTTITVESRGAAENVRYSIDGGETWQETGLFENLIPGSEYTIIAYYAEGEGILASEISDSLTVTTVPADTYVVANEEELYTAFEEIATLPAKEPRVNVRFENSITVSDTLILPRLRGRMKLYLDLYGFELKCEKPNVPVVQIETRAVLGSSYYLESGVTSEQTRGGTITATGNGCGVLVGAGGMAELNALTFNSDIAVENNGEIETLEHIEGRIENEGYIGTISDASAEATESEQWLLYNNGVIDSVTGCSYTGHYSSSNYSEDTIGLVHNLGSIGELKDTTINTSGMAGVFNGPGADIGTISGSKWKGSTWYIGNCCLNYGTIDTIKDGTYIARTSLFLNFGTISQILGGYFQCDYNIEYKDRKTLLDNGAVIACFGNWGTISDVAGGMYTNVETGSAYDTDTYRNVDGVYYSDKAFLSCTENAVFNYRTGFGMSRTCIAEEDTGRRGHIVGKLYKVEYDTSEALFVQTGSSLGNSYEHSDVVLEGTNSIKDYSTGEWNTYTVRAPEEKPSWHYYCAGEKIDAGNITNGYGSKNFYSFNCE